MMPMQVETTLGALREMSKLVDRVALSEPITTFLLDNGYRHDDTQVVVAAGDVWVAGER